MKQRSAETKPIGPLPNHVAIIMDGNVRWARQHHLTRLQGHRAGTDNIRRVVETFARYKVNYLTLYAFSTENWRRSKSEVNELMLILGRVIGRETKALHKKGVRLRHLGRLDRLAPKLQEQIRYALDLTRENTVINLSVAFDYGGRAEIIEAMQQIARENVPVETVDEALFSKYLYTADIPDPDLIIRTAGEMRLSNFLLWQSAYSELYTTPVFWPDFNEEEIRKALIAYSQRERNFGG